MLSDKFVHKLLQARDERHELLSRALCESRSATLFLSLNMPGVEKSPPGSAALFAWALAELVRLLPDVRYIAQDCDALGPYALFVSDLPPADAKGACMRLEERHPAARLVDLDVYSADGAQIGRSALDLPGRSCLVCEQPAVDCMRLKRHTHDQVIDKAHGLLAHFGA